MGMQEVAIKLSMDSSSFVSSAQNVAEAFAKITEKAKEARQAGNDDLAAKFDMQAMNLQSIYNGMASGNQGGGMNSSGGGSVVQAAQTGGNAINQAVSQAGRGDILGSAISGTKGGLDVIGKMGDQTAKAAGMLGLPLLGLMVGNTLTNFYEQQMESAMDITAALYNTNKKTMSAKNYAGLSEEEKKDYTVRREGDYIETDAARIRKNSENIHNSFDMAAKAAVDFGYSMEEGMQLVKGAAAYGYSNKDIYSAEENIFKWARGTGVDTGTLLKYKGSRFRYGDDSYNSLSAAFKVNTSMGMGKGQFSETLQALSSIFEDGISKGFVKGTAEIGSTLAALYKASGNSPLWQGEQGAQRYLQMSNTVANATALGSVSDVLSYKAASTLNKSAKTAALKNAGIKGSYGYIDNMIALEGGITTDLINAQRQAVKQYAGEGNDAGMIEQYRKMYGLNYSGAAKIFEMLKSGMSDESVKAEIKKITDSFEFKSEELKALKASQDMRKTVADIGKELLPIKTGINAIVLNTASLAGGNISFTEFLGNAGSGKLPETDKRKTRQLQLEKEIKSLETNKTLTLSSGYVNDELIKNLDKQIEALTKELTKLNTEGLELSK